MYKNNVYIIKFSMIRHSRDIKYIIIILVVLGIYISFKIINKKVSPIMISIAEDEAKKISDIIINDSVKKELDNGLTFDKLFITTYENDKLSTIDFDSIIVNKFLNNVTNNIIINIKSIETGNIDNLDILNNYNKDKLRKGIIYEIPLSYSYNNIFLSNLSPKIPVKIHMIGNVNTNVRTKVTDYGINNALLEVYIDIDLELQVILPLLSSKITNKSSVPIAIKMINGNIPKYFSNGEKNNSLSIPIE